MKRHFLVIASLILLASGSAMAQFPYTLTTMTGQTYTPLSGATNLTAGLVWDDEYLNLPLPFPVNIAGRSSSNLMLEMGMGGIFTDSQNVANGLFFSDADLVDRGQVSSIASSPLRYQTTGTAPNRIFKFEIKNAGFYDDTPALDSLNMQIWLYETGGIIEYRYGPSYVADPFEVYFIGNGPMTGVAINLDIANGTADKLYSFAGSTTAPTIDSIDLTTFTGNVLNATPASGIVYRLAPMIATGVGSLAQMTKVAVYPTNPRETLNVNYEEKEGSKYVVVGVDGKTTNLNGTFQRGVNRIDVSNIPAGMYILKASNETGTGSWRFVKM